MVIVSPCAISLSDPVKEKVHSVAASANVLLSTNDVPASPCCRTPVDVVIDEAGIPLEELAMVADTLRDGKFLYRGKGPLCVMFGAMMPAAIVTVQDDSAASVAFPRVRLRWAFAVPLSMLTEALNVVPPQPLE